MQRPDPKVAQPYAQSHYFRHGCSLGNSFTQMWMSRFALFLNCSLFSESAVAFPWISDLGFPNGSSCGTLDVFISSFCILSSVRCLFTSFVRFHIESFGFKGKELFAIVLIYLVPHCVDKHVENGYSSFSTLMRIIHGCISPILLYNKLSPKPAALRQEALLSLLVSVGGWLIL